MGFILGTLLFALIMTAGGWWTGSLTTKILAVLGWILLGFSIYFFRDPERVIPPGEDTLVSPADGKVVAIRDTVENYFIHGPAKQISIFLSVFDVHVNRAPMSGTVGFFHYQPGKFVPAYKSVASAENEQTIIGIERDSTRIVVKQIAGILARRIVCYLREGFRVKKGERIGMIKFGSRVDLFLPPEAEISVQLNQKVKGGETIVAKLNSK